MRSEPVIVQSPRRDAVLILPHLRRIIDASLAAMGYQWREGVEPRYRPSYDTDDITIKINEPIQATIVGQWAESTVPYQMWFSCHVLEFSMSAATTVPPLAPLGYSSPGPVIDVGEILRPVDPLEPRPRERVIDLD